MGFRRASRRTFLKVAAAGATGFAVGGGSTRGADVPVTGEAQPALAGFDALMTDFLRKTGVPGAAVAVTKNGRLVYARGFGFAEEGKPVEPDALFRIASISKPITAAAVLRLVGQGKLDLDGRALDVVTLRPAAGKELDPRWRDITLRHLLRHTAGWDRGKSGDPIGRPAEIARTLEMELPVGPEEVVRYTVGLPLDFDPGSAYAYSNVGYLVLGRAIEAATGRKYEEYVRAEILGPLGITSPRLGKARIEERLPREVMYRDAEKRTGPAVVGPRIGEEVPLPYGAENLDGYEAHGGWVASAVDLVKFACAFDDPERCPILDRSAIESMWERPAGRPGHEEDGNPKAMFYGLGWLVRPVREGKANTWHNGLIAGTSTLLVRRWDGINWAVLFNTQATEGGERLSDLVDPLVHPVADGVKEWPEGDFFPKYLEDG